MNDMTRQNVTGGDVLVDTLIAHGVDTAFTVSGESFLAVLEAVRRTRNQIRLVTTRHEGGGAFAADVREWRTSGTDGLRVDSYHSNVIHSYAYIYIFDDISI